ncbi:sulfotransferase 1B1-like [Dermacentor andersoni]|uniref:sulfotransferase 1B1-like n=1 Tax=Dermacentor andersoni TaxID=34620 RepID=UPI0021554564|nr:sulfotransferase 1B1-like [Dermacentor andersoni]XP_054928690.1 sulfotransferase 1B1-like [Dermacentor andersoni]
MDQESYRFVEGVWMHNFFRDENIHSAIHYKPRQGDIIVVTYPKTGTNWVVHIVYNILSRGKELPNVGEFSLMCPFIDITGAGPAEDPSRTGPISTHLPMRVFTPVDNAKYIYVARNPYDCAVSYFHFLKGFTPKTVTDVSFERYLPLFLSGKVIYGDYFDHLLPWYERRNDTNVLFLTYEQLKEDTRAQVLMIADFLSVEHGAALREDSVILQRVLDACSLENMKVFFSDKPTNRVKKLVESAFKKSASFEMLKNIPTEAVEMHEGAGFVRKGIVGDWRNHFTQDQIEQMKAWIDKKTQGSDVMKLWNECDLP